MDWVNIAQNIEEVGGGARGALEGGYLIKLGIYGGKMGKLGHLCRVFEGEVKGVRQKRLLYTTSTFQPNSI